MIEYHVDLSDLRRVLEETGLLSKDHQCFPPPHGHVWTCTCGKTWMRPDCSESCEEWQPL